MRIASGSEYIQSSVSRNARTKRSTASLRVLSTLSLTTSTRMVWLRSDGTSLPLAMTRILPSSISLSPNGGDPQPMSICPDMTAVSVAGMPPVEVGTALDAELLAEAEHDGVGGGATGGIGDGGLLRRILEALDRRIRAHIEVDVAGAGEIRADHADRRALGEGAQHALRADIDAEIGAAGAHSLHR